MVPLANLKCREYGEVRAALTSTADDVLGCLGLDVLVRFPSVAVVLKHTTNINNFKY